MSTASQTGPVHTHMVVTQTKIVGIALLLAFFLGPFGLFCAAIRAAPLVSLGVPFLAAVLAAMIGTGAAAQSSGLLALGGLAMIPLGLLVMWMLSLILAVTSVNAYSRRLLATP